MAATNPQNFSTNPAPSTNPQRFLEEDFMEIDTVSSETSYEEISENESQYINSNFKCDSQIND